MAVELMNGYTSTSFFTKMEENGVHEAATAGLQSTENLIRLISQSQQQQSQNLSPTPTTDYNTFADVAVTKFKKFISLLDRNRTGHARFRRGPVSDLPQHQKTSNERVGGSKVYCPIPIQQLPPLPHNRLIKHGLNHKKEPTTTTINFGDSALIHENSFISSLTGDTSSIRPPSLKRKCSSIHDSTNVKCSGSSGKCHCHKKRKSRIKREVRVPAISLKMSDIPPDDFSWRKYGQKPIKGSPHPRGYYKCSSVKGCPARKHVERDLQDPTMLIVTYEEEHNHSQSPSLLLKSS